MRHRTSKAFATRLPENEAEQLEAAIEETGRSKAEIVRRAIRYYTSKNPDRITTLSPENSVERILANLEDDDA